MLALGVLYYLVRLNNDEDSGDDDLPWSDVLITECDRQGMYDFLRGRTIKRRVQLHHSSLTTSFLQLTTNSSVLQSQTLWPIYSAVNLMGLWDRPSALLDVGAHLGNSSLSVLSLRSHHTVIAAEPIASNMRQLCVSVALNGWLGCPKVILTHAALSDRESHVDVMIGRDGTALFGQNSARQDATRYSDEFRRVERVQTVLGDDLLREVNVRPNLIRIRASRHEAHVLRGLRHYLRESRGGELLVLVEYESSLTTGADVPPDAGAMPLYDLMVRQLAFQAYSKPNVSVVGGRWVVEGVALSRHRFPPKGCSELIFHRMSPLQL